MNIIELFSEVNSIDINPTQPEITNFVKEEKIFINTCAHFTTYCIFCFKRGISLFHFEKNITINREIT